MIRIPCPHCGRRNSNEFRYVGDTRTRPEGAEMTKHEFRRYLYEQNNTLGWVRERWFHAAGCRRFVCIERHTMTNECRPVAIGADGLAP
jgi:heterotetrameric sarcosine oxidase delta subunit